MEQTRALNALEPFLLLSRSANSARAAADLVTQATSAPNAYVFAELLHTPNIQVLRQSAEYAGHLRMLEIFAWGTWGDYYRTDKGVVNGDVNGDADGDSTAALQPTNPSLPPLTPPQQQKLRLLTLFPLSSSHKTLTYPHLQQALSLPSARALEDLVRTAVTAGLLTATLDPARRVVAVRAVAPLRDLAPGSVPGMQHALAAWAGRCEGVLADLEGRIEDVKGRARERSRREKLVERAVERGVGGEDAGRGAAKRAAESVLGGEGAAVGAKYLDGYGTAVDEMDVDSVDVLGRGGNRAAKRTTGLHARRAEQ